MLSVTYVEIDIDYCSLTYGTSPCTAAIPATGAIKCFNTTRTCQDLANFSNSPVTLRFAIATDYLPRSIPAIPSLRSVSFSPAIVSLGEDLGQRASVTCTFEDHRHSDAGLGFDKYLSGRGYDPFRQGTFFGKFRARQPYLTGRPLRLIRGLADQDISQMDTRHYVIESFDGPTPDGTFTITAKDVLKLASGDRAQAPRFSNGFLSANIAANAGSASLNPTGIGDAEYPASGYVAIGGREICAFTRSGNTLTLTRAQLNTTAQAHSANDRVQIVLGYVAQTPAAIIYDLLVNYADVPASYIDLAAWEAEVDQYLDRVYTAYIAEPTPVEDLISELVKQATLAIWWDDAARKLRLTVIRAIPSSATVFSDDNIMEGSLQTSEQPERRISEVQTYFAQRSPIGGVEDPSNYRSCVITTNLDAVAKYGTNAIKTLFSRWIPFGGRTIAERVNAIFLGRFEDAPRRFSHSLFRYGNIKPALGGGYQLQAWPLQSATGARENVPIQIVSLDPREDRYDVESEEMRFSSRFISEDDLSSRSIVIDGDTQNINLRILHDTLYPVPTSGDAATVTVTCVIESGVTVGSDSTASPAFRMGAWPSGWDQDNLILINRGTIQGCGGAGGAGGDGGVVGSSGSAGGPAFYTRVNVTLDNIGNIWGGGGGGGGGGGTTEGFAGASGGGGGGGGGQGRLGGGGGAGGAARVYGAAGSSGSDSAVGSGGAGGSGNGSGSGAPYAGAGGSGGGPGAAGSNGAAAGTGGIYAGGAGGAAGNSIDGVSYVTSVTAGSKLGPQIN